MAGFNRGNPFAGFSGFGGKNASPMLRQPAPIQQIGRMIPPMQKIGAGLPSMGMPQLSVPARPQQPSFPSPASMPGPTYNGRPVASMPEFSTRPAPTPMAATYNGRKVAPMSDEPQIEDPPLPPAELSKEEKRRKFWRNFADNIKWGVKNSHGKIGGIGGMAAMLGVPYYHRDPGGDWMTYDPRRQAIYPMGATPYYGPSAAGNGNGNNNGGGDDTPTDPNAPPPLPGDKYKKNLIPEWWKDWYRTQGQYGGVPPVQGLL